MFTRNSPVKGGAAHPSLVDAQRANLAILFKDFLPLAARVSAGDGAAGGEAARGGGLGGAASAGGSTLHAHMHRKESQAAANRRPDPRWVDKLVELIAEEFLPLALVGKTAFRE